MRAAKNREAEGRLGHRGADGGGSDGLRSGGRGSVAVDIGLVLLFAVGVGRTLGALARDVANLAACVAGPAGGVERTAAGSRAVARDVTELAAGIALHGLGLAVTGKVVGAAALVASSMAGTTHKAATAVSEAAADGTPGEAGNGGVGAVALGARVSGEGTIEETLNGIDTYSNVADSVAVVAAVGAAAQAEGRALGLDVTHTLAVVALLGLGSAGHGALVGLMVRLLAWSER
jgi:hypothetical protein